MEITFENNRDALYIRLIGELDHHVAKNIGERMDFEIFLRSPKTVYLDFDALSFMDSSGLAVVMGRRRACTAIGAQLVLENLKGSIQKVFLMSGIQKYVKIKEKIHESK